MKQAAFVGQDMASNSVFLDLYTSKQNTPLVNISVPADEENAAYKFNLELGTQFHLESYKTKTFMVSSLCESECNVEQQNKWIMPKSNSKREDFYGSYQRTEHMSLYDN